MSNLDEICELIILGLTTEGAHHKQWYLERIAKKLGLRVEEEYEPGVAP